METLLEKIQQLELKNKELEEKLQKYTNSYGHKRYYEKNKETVIQKANDNKKKTKETNPEKIKEYAHRAYLKRKEKLQKEKDLGINTFN
jgi:cell division septum initiation protein DivIVA